LRKPSSTVQNCIVTRRAGYGSRLARFAAEEMVTRNWFSFDSAQRDVRFYLKGLDHQNISK
jgi:hypothetical protein